MSVLGTILRRLFWFVVAVYAFVNTPWIILAWLAIFIGVGAHVLAVVLETALALKERK